MCQTSTFREKEILLGAPKKPNGGDRGDLLGRLNNLVMIVNCNYQRLDGPVRGNSKAPRLFKSTSGKGGWKGL